jgi:peptidyl-prolyl cis-trans isomerase SurA
VRTALLLAALAGLTASPGLGQASPPAGELVDRVVAVVDEEPILMSDLQRAIRLGLVERREGESEAALLRRTLDEWIERRLRLAEIARFGFEEAPLEEVERQIERLRARFPDEAAWRAELVALGLGEAEVRQLVARQLAVLSYLEQRLGPRAFVGLEEIQRYYDDELVPRLRAQGDPIPPVEEVREAIRAVVREQKLDREIELWTARLRRESDVIDLLDAPSKPLPPVVLELAPPPG